VFCINCGSEIKSTTKYCSNCGKLIKMELYENKLNRKGLTFYWKKIIGIDKKIIFAGSEIENEELKKPIIYYLVYIFARIKKIILGILIQIAIIFVLAVCFHLYIGNGGIKIFAKESLSLSHTIITQDDIGKIIDQYNNADIFERNRLKNDPLFRKLIDEKIIFFENK
jgi:hypothetical protein